MDEFSQNFPLYSSLKSQIKLEKKLNVSQKNSFLKKINKMNPAGIELIYIIIRTYELEQNNYKPISSSSLPFEGQFKDSSITFDLDKLPQELSLILYNFMGIHLKKIDEEKKLNRWKLDYHHKTTPVSKTNSKS